MKKVTTYTANIYIGLKEGYTGRLHTIDEVYCICQEFVDQIGFCVTVTPTRFVYKNGMEPGAVVGTINYPRYPSQPQDLEAKAMILANKLMVEFKQHRVSVVFPDKTIMLENFTLDDFKE